MKPGDIGEQIKITTANPFFRSINRFFEEVAELTRFAFHFFREAVKLPWEFNEWVRQCYLVGVKSFPLVVITGFILGLVLTIQSRPSLAAFGAESWLPAMISLSIIREIGPVITALIFAGKVGSGIGAELASMKTTEQIDAMEVSGINPFKYLVVTRVMAAATMLPLLVILADAIGLYGGYIGVNLKGDISFQLYVLQVFDSLAFADVFPAMIKTVVFGFAIGLISCYKGYHAAIGTEGVGAAANSAVVVGSLAVFIVDMIAVQITSLIS